MTEQKESDKKEIIEIIAIDPLKLGSSVMQQVDAIRSKSDDGKISESRVSALYRAIGFPTELMRDNHTIAKEEDRDMNVLGKLLSGPNGGNAEKYLISREGVLTKPVTEEVMVHLYGEPQFFGPTTHDNGQNIFPFIVSSKRVQPFSNTVGSMFFPGDEKLNGRSLRRPFLETVIRMRIALEDKDRESTLDNLIKKIEDSQKATGESTPTAGEQAKKEGDKEVTLRTVQKKIADAISVIAKQSNEIATRIVELDKLIPYTPRSLNSEKSPSDFVGPDETYLNNIIQKAILDVRSSKGNDFSDNDLFNILFPKDGKPKDESIKKLYNALGSEGLKQFKLQQVKALDEANSKNIQTESEGIQSSVNDPFNTKRLINISNNFLSSDLVRVISPNGKKYEKQLQKIDRVIAEIRSEQEQLRAKKELIYGFNSGIGLVHLLSIFLTLFTVDRKDLLGIMSDVDYNRFIAERLVLDRGLKSDLALRLVSGTESHEYLNEIKDQFKRNESALSSINIIEAEVRKILTLAESVRGPRGQTNRDSKEKGRVGG